MICSHHNYILQCQLSEVHQRVQNTQHHSRAPHKAWKAVCQHRSLDAAFELRAI